MAMVPLDPAAMWHVRSWLGPPDGPGLLALHHALAFRVPGVWGAPASAPRSVILVREGEGRIEAFGAGEPEPAVGWLLRSRRPFGLHAPDSWHEAVATRLGAVDFDPVETWGGPGVSLPMRPLARSRSGSGPQAGNLETATTGVTTRRLTTFDATAFAAHAPSWALRGWRTFPALLEHGAAFGVPHAAGFAAMAWVFDRAENFDGLAVHTAPRFRRLGLGRAVASALIDHLVRDRGQIPLWSTPPENEPSRQLARALGFSVASVETLLRWPPRTRDGETDES